MVINLFINYKKISLGDEIGRHEGLKIPWTVMSVWVRFPS